MSKREAAVAINSIAQQARPIGIGQSEFLRTQLSAASKRVNNDFEPDSTRPTREPEHFHFSRGVSSLQKRRHAVVNGEGFQRSYLARPQIFFWEDPLSGPAHRHDLRISRDAGVS